MTAPSIKYESLRKLVIMVAKKINLNYKVDNVDGDGRLMSAIMEKSFLDKLESGIHEINENIKIIRPAIRHWYDIMIENIPVNLKITSGGSDNAFNKTAIAYTILGYEAKQSHQLGFSEWYDFIKKHYDSNMTRTHCKEYHYLVIHKNDPSKVLFKSILDINTYRVNPSNILQIKWKHEFNHFTYSIGNDNSTYQNKKLELLKCIQTSLVKEYSSKRTFIEAHIDVDLDLDHKRKKTRKH